MKIAFLHFAYCCGPQADNAKKILQGMKLAAQKGASWVLTPEMALQGYYMMRGDKQFQLASLQNNLLQDFMEACRQYKQRLFLGCGFVDEKLRVTAAQLFRRTEHIIIVTIKRRLCRG